MTEAQRKTLRDMRAALDGLVGKIVDSAQEVNQYTAAVREWKPGAYVAGDVRQYLGVPYKCVQAHDATENPGWTPDTVPALWMQYHGTSEETARAWVAPGGAHDQYLADEYMIWTDGAVYKCLSNTICSPADYAQAWEKVGSDAGGGTGETGAAAWVQPTTGAQDAYSAGDEVTHGGKTWVSDVDGNVWEPGVYGWTEKVG